MPDLNAFQAQFVTLVDRPDAPLSALTIYRNTSLSAAMQALADNFPVVSELVGDELFGALCLGFAEVSPPSSPILARYGADFPDWLSKQPIADEISYLADVARCERAFLDTLFAADADLLTGADLAHLTPETLLGLKLTVHPAVRFGWLSTPAIDIWLAHRRPVAREIVVDWQANGYLFTRPGLDPLGRVLGRPAHRFLSGLRIGETLGAAAEAVSTLYPDTDIGDLLATLLGAGCFACIIERT
jgi:hypothetical protein